MTALRVAIFAALLLAAAPAAAQTETTTAARPPDISVGQLDRDPQSWNGRRVSLTGEVIGDYGIRRHEVWVQINDDPYVESPLVESGELAGTNSGIGVRIPIELADIDTWGRPGRYRTRGPILQVTGVFLYASPDEGGDTFISAEAVTLVSPARTIESPPPDWDLFAAGVAMGLVGIGAVALLRWRRVRPQRVDRGTR